MEKKHFSFPSIEQFKNVRRRVQDKAQFKGLDENQEPIFDRLAKLPTITFKGTVKLHGTNASIVLTQDDFYCQTRERICTLEDDNAGFARFVYGLSKESLDVLRSNIGDKKVVVYGEWAGKGIQDSVAISELPKAMYVFAARVIGDNEEKEDWLDVTGWKLPNGFYNINDYRSFLIDIDFEKPEYAIEAINELVLEVEAQCPVAKALGVSGVGEGIVWRPIDPEYSDSKFIWKAKGDKHSKSKVTKLATVNIEKFESDQAFVNYALDEGRLEQGYKWLEENGKPQDATGTGDFIRWIVGDVNKECKLEMEKNNISEKELGKLLATPAKRWYFARLNK